MATRSYGPSYAARRELAAWTVLVAVVLATAGTAYLGQAATTTQDSSKTRVRHELRLMGQYAVGVRTLLGETPAGRQIGVRLFADLEQQAASLPERVVMAILAAEIESVDGARSRLEALRSETRRGEVPAAEPAEDVAADLAALDRLWGGTAPPAEDDRARLVDRYGWFGELAVSRGTEDRSVVLGPAVGTAVVLVAALLAGAVCLAIGTLLLATLLVRMVRGRMDDGFLVLHRAMPADRVAFLESTALFMASLFVLSVLAGWIEHKGGGRLSQLVIVLALPAVAWPLAHRIGGRRVDWPQLRRVLGWTRGRGLWAEMSSGLVAYVAGLPLLAAGLALSFVLVQVVGAPPYHPVLDWVREAGPAGKLLVYLLACVWAPCVEESVFRGHFYSYLRGRLGIVGSVLIQALVFAAIHPQGLSGIPVLAALASVLALIREWRGSLVGSITVHAVHNFLAVSLLMLIFS